MKLPPNHEAIITGLRRAQRHPKHQIVPGALPHPILVVPAARGTKIIVGFLGSVEERHLQRQVLAVGLIQVPPHVRDPACGLHPGVDKQRPALCGGRLGQICVQGHVLEAREPRGRVKRDPVQLVAVRRKHLQHAVVRPLGRGLGARRGRRPRSVVEVQPCKRQHRPLVVGVCLMDQPRVHAHASVNERAPLGRGNVGWHNILVIADLGRCIVPIDCVREHFPSIFPDDRINEVVGGAGVGEIPHLAGDVRHVVDGVRPDPHFPAVVPDPVVCAAQVPHGHPHCCEQVRGHEHVPVRAARDRRGRGAGRTELAALLVEDPLLVHLRGLEAVQRRGPAEDGHGIAGLCCKLRPVVQTGGVLPEDVGGEAAVPRVPPGRMQQGWGLHGHSSDAERGGQQHQ
mmetsp:Transcript_1163/g.1759  ORF Transcript_1163/g.1759 Transcript_1163/m.1759 type:complete len:399 (-) Transcript_1163:39-1235(-)